MPTRNLYEAPHSETAWSSSLDEEEQCRRRVWRRFAIAAAIYAGYSAILGAVLTLVPAIVVYLEGGLRSHGSLLLIPAIAGPPALLAWFGEVPSWYILSTCIVAVLGWGAIAGRSVGTRVFLSVGFVLAWMFFGSCSTAPLI